MGDFLENLWGSVFTPGATPTLIVATNATFAALQLLLLTLLIVTYSIHFAILSVLCAGLWFSINWFANELQQAQATEEEAERLRKQKKATAKSPSSWKQTGEVGDSGADDEGEDTETEGQGMRESVPSVTFEPSEEDERVRGEIMEAMKASGRANMGVAASGAQTGDGASEARQRKVEDGDRSMNSTDSEWEKVDDER